MENKSKIVIAWPEDHLLEGDELEQLKNELAPHGRRALEALGDHGYLSDQVGEAMDDCKKAIVHTLGALSCEPTIRGLTDTIDTCWKRSEEEAGRHPAFDNTRARQSLLNAAIINMKNHNELAVDNIGFRVSLPVEAAATAEA